MKCLVQGCSSQIDELKEFPVTYGPNGVTDEHVAGQRAHAAVLEKWTFMLVVARGNRDDELTAGHVCPNHVGQTFGITAYGKDD